MAKTKTALKNIDIVKKNFDKFLVSDKSSNTTELFLYSMNRVSKHIYNKSYKEYKEGTPFFIAHYESFLRENLDSLFYNDLTYVIELLEYMYIKAYDKYLKNSEIKNQFILTINDWRTIGEKMENFELCTFIQKLKTFIDTQDFFN